MPAWQRKWKNYKYTHTHILKKKTQAAPGTDPSLWHRCLNREESACFFSRNFKIKERNHRRNLESQVFITKPQKRSSRVSGEGKEVVSVNPEMFGKMYKLFSFRKDSGTTGQPLLRGASIILSEIFQNSGLQGP